MDGNRIKGILRDRRITQRKLAEMTGYSENYISKMLNQAETHPFTDEAALKVAHVLDIDPWDIKLDFADLTPDERTLVQSFRRVPRPNRGALMPLLLAMLDEASRFNAA